MQILWLRSALSSQVFGCRFWNEQGVFFVFCKEMDSGGESGVDRSDFNIATQLREAIKLRAVWSLSNRIYAVFVENSTN